jgi:hypothetical protein
VRQTLFSGAVFSACLLGAFGGQAAPAAAHGWYDIACCSDRDCEPLPIDAVVETATGYEVTFYSARLRFLVQGYVPRERIKISQDGSFHVCANPTRIICLYVPHSV